MNGGMIPRDMSLLRADIGRTSLWRVMGGVCGTPRAPLGEAGLLHEEGVVVLEVLLDDPAVTPTRDGREDDLERLARRLDHRPIGQLERPRERPREPCDEGRVLP